MTGAPDLALAPKLQQLVDRASRQTPEPTRVRVVAASRITLRPLETTRLTDELAVCPTLSAALAAE